MTKFRIIIVAELSDQEVNVLSTTVEPISEEVVVPCAEGPAVPCAEEEKKPDEPCEEKKPCCEGE